MIKIKAQSSLLIAAFNAVMLLCYNYTFWQHIPNSYVVPLAVLLFSIYYAALTLVNFKYTLKPVLLFLLCVACPSAYFMDSYGFIFSTQTVQTTTGTNAREIWEVLNFKLLPYLLLGVVFAIIIIKIKLRYPKFKFVLLHFFIALSLIFVNIALFSKSYSVFLRNNKPARYYLNPLRPIYASAKYYVTHLSYQNKGVNFTILDPTPQRTQPQSKPRLIVLVLGESDRAANHSLNSYSRNTDPLLRARTDIYSFTDFYSCGTETSLSVPCMFSNLGREHYNYVTGRYTENVLDLLQKSQVQVLWRDNDGGCQNVCNRVPTEDFNKAQIKPFCNGFECHDEVLLHNMQDYISNNIGDKLIVLHKKGNHGPAYYKRYPAKFEQFGPVCKARELKSCMSQEIINAYDNILLYNDYFLDQLIKQLEANQDQYQTAMIYVSDHGESLGEKSIYLHALPYWMAPKEQIHIPFIFWASKDFVVNRQHIAEIKHQTWSHDNLFHTLLGLYDIESSVYVADLDIFS